MKSLLSIFTLTSILIFTSFYAYGQACSCVTGMYNTAVSGLNNLTTGQGNVGVGIYAGNSLNTGDYSTAVGYQCLSYGSGLGGGSYITAMGYKAGSSTIGDMAYSTLLGSNSAQYFRGGHSNTMLGYGTGASGSGQKNVFVGHGAGAANGGNGNIIIGADMYFGASSYNNYLFIGNYSNKEFLVGDIANGKLGINTNTPQNALDVCGKIRSDEVICETNWCDYVFYEDYDLPDLSKEEQHIEEKGHLMGFQSEEEMSGEIRVADVTKRQQVKIEEMMLHLIEMNKRLDMLETENTRLKEEVKQLRSR